MQIDRRLFLGSLGGVAAVRAMSNSIRLVAKRHHRSFRLRPRWKPRSKLVFIAEASGTCF